MPATEAEKIAVPRCGRRISVLFAIPALDKGGPDRVFFELLCKIDRTRLAPALVTSQPDGHYLARLPSDIAVHHLGRETGLFTRYPVFALGQLVRQLRPDVVLTTLRMCLTAGLARPLFPRDTRLIIRPANQPSSNAQELIRSAPIKHRLSFMLNRFALGRADHIVCQGEDLAGDLHAVGLHTAMSVIGNPIDVEEIVRLSGGPGALLGAPALLAVGRLTRQKGFDLLLPAFAQVRKTRPDAHLTIVGSGVEGAALARQCDALALTGSVTFLGFVDNPYPLMRMADLFVLSSRYEGFPNVVLEALACGTPVAACAGPGITQLVKPGITGWLVPSENVEELARVIVEATAHPGLLKSAALRAWVREEFGSDKIVRRYENLLIQQATS